MHSPAAALRLSDARMHAPRGSEHENLLHELQVQYVVVYSVCVCSILDHTLAILTGRTPLAQSSTRGVDLKS